jgi:hypothetical protein
MVPDTRSLPFPHNLARLVCSFNIVFKSITYDQPLNPWYPTMGGGYHQDNAKVIPLQLKTLNGGPGIGEHTLDGGASSESAFYPYDYMSSSSSQSDWSPGSSPSEDDSSIAESIINLPPATFNGEMSSAAAFFDPNSVHPIQNYVPQDFPPVEATECSTNFTKIHLENEYNHEITLSMLAAPGFNPQDPLTIRHTDCGAHPGYESGSSSGDRYLERGSNLQQWSPNRLTNSQLHRPRSPLLDTRNNTLNPIAQPQCAFQYGSCYPLTAGYEAISLVPAMYYPPTGLQSRFADGQASFPPGFIECADHQDTNSNAFRVHYCTKHPESASWFPSATCLWEGCTLKCKMPFKTRNAWLEHVHNVHLKNFYCQVADCENKGPFGTQAMVDRHCASVHDPPIHCNKPHCQSRGANLRRRDKETEHKKKWHGHLECEVDGCVRRHRDGEQYGFSTQSDLEKHMDEKHGLALRNCDK